MSHEVADQGGKPAKTSNILPVTAAPLGRNHILRASEGVFDEEI
jgi:hypothetical protein